MWCREAGEYGIRLGEGVRGQGHVFAAVQAPLDRTRRQAVLTMPIAHGGDEAIGIDSERGGHLPLATNLPPGPWDEGYRARHRFADVNGSKHSDVQRFIAVSRADTGAIFR